MMIVVDMLPSLILLCFLTKIRRISIIQPKKSIRKKSLSQLIRMIRMIKTILVNLRNLLVKEVFIFLFLESMLLSEDAGSSISL